MHHQHSYNEVEEQNLLNNQYNESGHWHHRTNSATNINSMYSNAVSSYFQQPPAPHQFIKAYKQPQTYQ